MAVIVIIGSIALGKRDTERNAEEVWEPPVVIESTEAVKEDESIECFGERIPQFCRNSHRGEAGTCQYPDSRRRTGFAGRGNVGSGAVHGVLSGD